MRSRLSDPGADPITEPLMAVLPPFQSGSNSLSRSRTSRHPLSRTEQRGGVTGEGLGWRREVGDGGSPGGLLAGARRRRKAHPPRRPRGSGTDTRSVKSLLSSKKQVHPNAISRTPLSPLPFHLSLPALSPISPARQGFLNPYFLIAPSILYLFRSATFRAQLAARLALPSHPPAISSDSFCSVFLSLSFLWPARSTPLSRRHLAFYCLRAPLVALR